MIKIMAKLCLIALLLTAVPFAAVSDVSPPATSGQYSAFDLNLDGGIYAVIYLHTLGPSPSLGATVSGNARFENGLELFLGARVLKGLRLAHPIGVEAFGGLALSAKIGTWLPRAGLEVGWSLASDLGGDPSLLPGSMAAAMGEIAPFYLAFVTSPLRFSLGNLSLSALEVALGTPLPGPGRAVRFGLGVITLGWRF